jgi:hypothetical protein
MPNLINIEKIFELIKYFYEEIKNFVVNRISLYKKLKRGDVVQLKNGNSVKFLEYEKSGIKFWKWHKIFKGTKEGMWTQGNSVVIYGSVPYNPDRIHIFDFSISDIRCIK